MKDFILIGNKEYRVEINMNTVEDWESLAQLKLGQFELQAAESVKTGGVPTRAMLLWLFCAIREGEQLEGREFKYDFREFKRMLKPSVMSTFAPIFIKQYIGEQSKTEPDNEVKKKKTPIRSLLGKLGGWYWVLWVGLLILLLYAAQVYFGTP